MYTAQSWDGDLDRIRRRNEERERALGNISSECFVSNWCILYHRPRKDTTAETHLSVKSRNRHFQCPQTPAHPFDHQSGALTNKLSRLQTLAGEAGEFSSPELTLCAESYSVSVPPCVTAVARERSRSFCQKYRWQITPKHKYTLDPTKSEWADNAIVQATCQGTFGHSRLSSLSHCGQILA